MEESTNREKVLKKVRSALISKTSNPFPNLDMDSRVYNGDGIPVEIQFAESFLHNGGNFVLCNGRIELMETILGVCDAHNYTDLVCVDKNLSAFLDEFEFPHQSIYDPEQDTDLQVVMIPCECLIAHNGAVIVSNDNLFQPSLLQVTRNLIVVAHTHQMVFDYNEALAFLRSQHDKLPSTLHTLHAGYLKQLHHYADDNQSGAITVILIQPYENQVG
jgi:L-lactate dehydrogenase complex protein LldG